MIAWHSHKMAAEMSRDLAAPVELMSILLLQWRHNERDGVSNYQRLDCLLKRLFRRRLKKTSKLRVTGLCDGNSPVIGEFPAQKGPVTRQMFPFDDVFMKNPTWGDHVRVTDRLHLVHVITGDPIIKTRIEFVQHLHHLHWRALGGDR